MLFSKPFRRRTCPISKLPNELLNKIFLYSRDHEDRLKTPPLTTPWSLLAVCCRWSDIALSTPQLWDSLLIELEGTEDPEILLPYLAVYLYYGGGFPLDFTLRISNDYPSNSHPFLDMLAVYASRWRNISIHAHHSMIKFLLIKKQLRGGFPSLESVTLDASLRSDERYEFRFASPITRFYRSPKLRNVDLRGASQFYYILLADGSKLHRYSSSYSYFANLHRILVTAANLVTAEFFLDCDILDFFAIDRARIKLPSLKNLVVTSRDIDYFRFLFPFLYTPELSSLQLRCDNVDTIDTQIELFASLSEFVDRSQCKLEEFGLEGTWIIDESILIPLHRMPNLRVITIPGPTIYSAFSSLRLILEPDHPTFLPNLEMVRIGWRQGTSVLVQAFKDWLQSQIPSVLAARKGKISKVLSARRFLVNAGALLSRRDHPIYKAMLRGYCALIFIVDLAIVLRRLYTYFVS